MRDRTWLATLSVGSLVVLSACAPEPAPQIIFAEHVFDKLANPSCRPGDVPIGGAYTADLPLCSVTSGAPVTVVTVPVLDENGDSVSVTDPDSPDDEPTDGDPNRNQIQKENNEQNNQRSGGS